MHIEQHFGYIDDDADDADDADDDDDDDGITVLRHINTKSMKRVIPCQNR